MSSTSGHNEDKGIQSLIKKRRSDLLEEYEQEFESYRQLKQRKTASNSSDEEEDFDLQQPDPKSLKLDPNTENAPILNTAGSSKGWALMAKAGYKSGMGLGSRNQGRVEPVESSAQTGRLGLGHEATKTLAPNSEFYFSADAEIKTVEEIPLWINSSDDAREAIARKSNDEWIVVTKPKCEIEDETRYCEESLISEVLKCKSIFDHVKGRDLNDARARANPYETVKAGFFQNRAAMKTANIDRVFGWILSREFDRTKRLTKNPLEPGLDRINTDRDDRMFYFADVCAGPGGFSEYMLWRKGFYNAKGFGFTLTGKDDFKLNKFKAASPEYFETYYGVKEDGNVMDPANISSLENYVKSRTNGAGVHLVTCDGGFSVEGQENIQEILSKRLYLCQFIVGLSLARSAKEGRTGGNFLCKLFDIFTPFSVGLIYLMRAAFTRISLHKPITSRPANSERYIFCENLTEFGATIVKDYLVEINNRMDKIASERRSNTEDIYEIVPHDLMHEDETFCNYIRQHIESIALRQIFYLKKYLHFTQNKGAYDVDQANIREQCLSYWELPNVERGNAAERFARPFMMSLNKLTNGNVRLNCCFSAPFYSNVLKQSTEKHIVSAEFRAILLPESSEPMLLMSNGGSNIGIYKNDNFERLGITQLPFDTVLLVQETEKYEMGGPKLMKSKLLYIVDAAILNGDDISHLPLSKRLAATKKFCDAVNKCQPSSSLTSNGRRDYGDLNQCCEIVCAEAMHIDALVNMNLETKKFKGSDMAVFNPCGKSNVNTTCRAVRFVNILKPSCSIFWSKTNCNNYIFDHTKNLSLHEAPAEFYSSFYDCLHNTNAMNGAQRNESFPSRSWLWSWGPKHGRNFTVTNILNDKEHEAGPTMKFLKSLLEVESNNIKNN